MLCMVEIGSYAKDVQHQVLKDYTLDEYVNLSVKELKSNSSVTFLSSDYLGKNQTDGAVIQYFGKHMNKVITRYVLVMK